MAELEWSRTADIRYLLEALNKEKDPRVKRDIVAVLRQQIKQLENLGDLSEPERLLIGLGRHYVKAQDLSSTQLAERQIQSDAKSE